MILIGEILIINTIKYVFGMSLLIIILKYNFSAIYFDATSSLSDQILIAALQLLNKEISDHGRHLSHYFSLFHIYCGFGTAEKAQLLKVCVVILLLIKNTL